MNQSGTKETGMDVMLDSASRVFVDAAVAPEYFDREFIDFLSKALAPTAENNRTSRIDNLIATAILNACIVKGTILDLCCGWPVLLETLIEQLNADSTRDTDYHFVACDMIASTDAFKNKWKKLEPKRPGSLRMSAIAIDVSQTRHNGCHSFCAARSSDGRLRGPRSWVGGLLGGS